MGVRRKQAQIFQYSGIRRGLPRGVQERLPFFFLQSTLQGAVTTLLGPVETNGENLEILGRGNYRGDRGNSLKITAPEINSLS